MFQINHTDLRKLNSLTKYPSIPTYHAMGDKGQLTDELSEDFAGKQVFATEKVDGTNSRIIFTPDGSYLIGSREELLHAKGDLIFNPVLDIVETVRPLAEVLLAVVFELAKDRDALAAVYLETYGGKIGSNAKQYTSERHRGFRLFDVALVPLAMFDESVEAIAAWRENKGQTYLHREQLTAFAGRATSLSFLTFTLEMAVTCHVTSRECLSFFDRQFPKRELPSTREQKGGQRAWSSGLRIDSRSRRSAMRTTSGR